MDSRPGSLLGAAVVCSLLLSCRSEEPAERRQIETPPETTEARTGGPPSPPPARTEQPAGTSEPERAAGAGSPELHPARLPVGAYQACKDSTASIVPEAENGTWGKEPDSVERAPGDDAYRIVAQVRPDSLQPGISVLCVVAPMGDGWQVMLLQTQ